MFGRESGAFLLGSHGREVFGEGGDVGVGGVAVEKEVVCEADGAPEPVCEDGVG